MLLDFANDGTGFFCRLNPIQYDIHLAKKQFFPFVLALQKSAFARLAHKAHKVQGLRFEALLHPFSLRSLEANRSIVLFSFYIN